MLVNIGSRSVDATNQLHPITLIVFAFPARPRDKSRVRSRD